MADHEHVFSERRASEVQNGDFIKHPAKGDDWVVDGVDRMPTSETTILWVRPDEGWEGEVDMLTFEDDETVLSCPKDTPS